MPCIFALSADGGNRHRGALHGHLLDPDSSEEPLCHFVLGEGSRDRGEVAVPVVRFGFMDLTEAQTSGRVVSFDSGNVSLGVKHSSVGIPLGLAGHFDVREHLEIIIGGDIRFEECSGSVHVQGDCGCSVIRCHREGSVGIGRIVTNAGTEVAALIWVDQRMAHLVPEPQTLTEDKDVRHAGFGIDGSRARIADGDVFLGFVFCAEGLNIADFTSEFNRAEVGAKAMSVCMIVNFRLCRCSRRGCGVCNTAVGPRLGHPSSENGGDLGRGPGVSVVAGAPESRDAPSGVVVSGSTIVLAVVAITSGLAAVS